MSLPTIGTFFASEERSHLAIPAIIVKHMAQQCRGVVRIFWL